MAGSDLLKNMLSNAGVSNAENRDKARLELAGAITRIVLNETIAEAKARRAEMDRMTIPTGAETAE